MANFRLPGRRGGLRVAVVAMIITLAGAAHARQPPVPVRAETADIYSGRWYEIARTPNKVQRECDGPTTDFQGVTAIDVVVTMTCHGHGSDGVIKTVRAKARLLDPGQNTHFRMSFLGGLVRQDYWILDHADDNAWMIMATPGGNYVWLLARRPALPAAALKIANAHVAALGFPLTRLVHAGPGADQGG